jgi:hypothetical protein
MVVDSYSDGIRQHLEKKLKKHEFLKVFQEKSRKVLNELLNFFKPQYTDFWVQQEVIFFQNFRSLFLAHMTCFHARKFYSFSVKVPEFSKFKFEVTRVFWWKPISTCLDKFWLIFGKFSRKLKTFRKISNFGDTWKVNFFLNFPMRNQYFPIFYTR